jgi:hypothetical protein
MNCLNCGAAITPKLEKCSYCGTYHASKTTYPLALIKNKKFRKFGLYPFVIGFGVIIAILVYAVYFDNLSETALINLTPVWYFALIFGLYGYKAERLMTMVVNGEAEDFRDAYKKWIRELSEISPIVSFLAALLYFPFPLFNRMSPLLTASSGAVIWGILLLVFFNGIFPKL